MLKQTVQFTDFDGVNKTKNLYFNLTRSEVIDNMELKDEFENVRDMIAGEQRTLEIHEVRLILDLVKKLMQLSYGLQKNVDGDLIFSKKPEIWETFIETAAYDAFLMQLFEDPGKAVEFLVGIWPREIMEQVDPNQLQLPDMPARNLQSVPDEAPVAPTGEAWQQYTPEALLAMTQEQFDRIAGTDPLEMPQELLQIAFTRKARGN